MPNKKGFLKYAIFTFIKHVWVVAMSDVDGKCSQVKLTWNDSKDSFEHFHLDTIRFMITLDQLRHLIHSNEDALEHTLEALFPASFPLSRAMALLWHKLQAPTSENESFLDSLEAWEWLKPALEDIMLAYMGSIGDSISFFNELLDRDKVFQQILVAIIIANTGVPPRGSTLQKYLY